MTTSNPTVSGFSFQTILRRGASLAFVQVMTMGFSFARNLILARTMSIEDMAVSSILAMIVTSLEMITDAGLSKYLIQTNNGDESRTLETAHWISILRGIGIGLFLLCAAIPLARLTSAEYATNAFFVIALIPVIRGFFHLDYVWQQRTLRLAATNAVELGGQIAGCTAAFAGGFLFADFRSGYFALIVQAVVMLFISHATAHRKYRCVCDKLVAKQIRHFGLPLAANGILTVLTVYGDRMILASCGALAPSSHIGLHEVGVYSLNFLLAFTLSMGLLRIVSTIALPVLARAKESKLKLEHIYKRVGIGIAVLAGSLQLFLSAFGCLVVTYCYGPAYNPGLNLMILLALVQSTRVLRANWNLASLSVGNSYGILYSNIARSFGLLLSVLALWTGFGILGLCYAGVMGELLASSVSIWVLVRMRGFSFGSSILPVCIFTMFLAIGWGISFAL